MSTRPNPEMLVLARELRGLTQTRLEEITGIRQVYISRYESGDQNIPEQDIQSLAEVLQLPVGFFFQEGERFGPESSEIFHRKRASLKVITQSQIHAQLNIIRLNADLLLKKAGINSRYVVPRYDVREFDGNIEHIAGAVRSAWQIPKGRILNLTAKMENASIFMLARDLQSDKIDETTQWCEPTPPIMLINKHVPGERLRFSIAHALGHLVMHHNVPPYDEMEKEADRFASALLMPDEDIRPDLEYDSITIPRLLQLKGKWRVSAQALIYRAYDLGIINQTRFTSLFQMLSRAGYRKKEPFPIPVEQPTLMRKIIEYYYNEKGFSISQIANIVNLSEFEFTNWYLSDAPDLWIMPKDVSDMTG